MSTARKIIAPQASVGKRLTSLGETREPTDDESPEHMRALERCEQRKMLTTIPDQVAEDTFYFRNYKWPTADRVFPDSFDAGMRFVSKYYPHAKGGPLYVDEVINSRELARATERAKILKGLKLRYIMVSEHWEFDGNIHEATKLQDALEQLGEQ